MSTGIDKRATKEGYALSELAERTGIQPRTIRSYIEQKLISGPSSRGRYARYGRPHLTRLLAIRELLDRGMRLADIRLMVATMTEPELEDLAGLAPYAVVGRQSSGREKGGGTALQYLEGLRGNRQSSSDGAPEVEASDPQSGGDSSGRIRQPAQAMSAPHGDQRLVERQQSGGRRQTPGRRPKAEPWYEIEITPDVKLEVRGTLDDGQRESQRRYLRRLERLADELRHKLLGGKDE